MGSVYPVPLTSGVQAQVEPRGRAWVLAWPPVPLTGGPAWVTCKNRKKAAVRARGLEPAPRRRATVVADHWATRSFCLDPDAKALWVRSELSELSEEVQTSEPDDGERRRPTAVRFRAPAMQ